MLQTLTWPTLQQRRLKTKLIMFYKIVRHIVAVSTTLLNIYCDVPQCEGLKLSMHNLVLDGQEIGMPATFYLCWKF
jgi:hypothetical protein